MSGTLEQRANALLLEAVSMMSSVVDPLDAVRGDRGELWGQVGGGQGLTTVTDWRPYISDSELDIVRARCRRLLIENEFALSAHQNRISYVVGTGHVYSVKHPDEQVRMRAQKALDRFVKSAAWGRRQQEIMLRWDRDGEVFLRHYPAGPDRGFLAVRFIEPEHVRNASGMLAADGWEYGVRVDPDDAETVLEYCVNGRVLPAACIQHRKANGDAAARRGTPLLYPVIANLERAEKLLRNMTVVSSIQAAIAMIRKHKAPSNAVGNLLAANTTTRTNPYTGAKETVRSYGAGSIIDAHESTEYQFPSIGVNASALVAVLQAELRAIGARLVMPEFMLTQDASNGNFASVLVAEGPAVKNFEREQWSVIEYDREILERVLDGLVLAGGITAEQRAECGIEAEPPMLVVRDRLAEVQANQVLLQSKIIDRGTWQRREGLDPTEIDAAIERDDLGGVGNIALPGLDAMGAGVPQ